MKKKKNSDSNTQSLFAEAYNNVINYKPLLFQNVIDLLFWVRRDTDTATAQSVQSLRCALNG